MEGGIGMGGRKKVENDIVILGYLILSHGLDISLPRHRLSLAVLG